MSDEKYVSDLQESTEETKCEALINQIGAELGCTSWKFCIEEVAPIDYTKDLALAEFLFQRGAMTIKELIDNFGNKFGLTIEDPDDYYLNARYINGQPLENIWNQTEQNPMLEVDSILGSLEDELRREAQPNEEPIIESKETDISLTSSE